MLWSHYVALIEKFNDPGIHLWYAAAAVKHGRSLNVVAGYASRGHSDPTGVADSKTQIMDSLPEEFASGR